MKAIGKNFFLSILNAHDSLERKMIAVITAIFILLLLVALVPFFVSGQYLFISLVFLVLTSSWAYYNSIALLKNDIIDPIVRLEEFTSKMAKGEVDLENEEINQRDEIGKLYRSFESLKNFQEIVSKKSGFLSELDFE